MTENQMKEISNLQLQGFGYKKIASTLNLSLNTVKSYCRRHPIEVKEKPVCLFCGKDFTDTKQRSSRKFCSDKCRLAWWRLHAKDKAPTEYVCQFCGRTFFGFKSKGRKYCSRTCYGNAKRKGDVNAG